MNRAGIVCDVLFPDDQNTNDPPFGSGLAHAVEGIIGTEGYPPALVRAGARAYNRWLADFCSADPKRLLGLTLLGTLDDPNWCVEEIDRAYDDGLRTGVVLPLEYYLPLYHHRRYDIIWERCSELGLTVCVHPGRGAPTYNGDNEYEERSVFLMEVGWYAHRPLWSFIIGGIFDRFPKLNLAFVELGIGWISPILERIAKGELNSSPAGRGGGGLRASGYPQCALGWRHLARRGRLAH
jgi:predicted TIM-barrel fold metal-dependent hydrolase